MPQPQYKTYQQILGDMMDTFMSKVGVNDVNKGAVSRSFFETIAQQIARSNGDMIAALYVYDVDKAVADVLRKIAKDEGVNLPPSKVATTYVTVIDSRYQKIETKVYAGNKPPNVGSSSIFVSDASEFPASGVIYIGRGTPNVEGPLSYSSKTPVGSYWQLNLTLPTQKYHNTSENVVLGQGGLRPILSGNLVRSPGTGAAPNVQFKISNTTYLLDGEISIGNVQVAALEPGTASNVPTGAIKEFVVPPFTGATVTNPTPVVDGRDPLTTDEIRDAIKRSRASKGLGTATAVENSVINAQASDESSRVVSSQVIRTPTKTTLYVDDGNVYEEKSAGVGVEPIVDSALGGEDTFQLALSGEQSSISKASLISSTKDPYDIRGLDRLAVIVGGSVVEHIFSDDDFRTPSAATAFEVVSSINSNPLINFTARTVEAGRKTLIKAKGEDDEQIQITVPQSGRDAAIAMGFPSNEVNTLLLFKNKNQRLDKNGRRAFIDGAEQASWSNLIQDGDELTIDVDGTGYRTYTFTDADFIKEGTHIRVARTNIITSWVNVINNKVTGITTEANGNALRINSNLGESSRASILIDPTCDFVTKGIFTVAKGLSAEGKEKDFALSRNTAQFQLTVPLKKGESLSAGSSFTKAAVNSGSTMGGLFSFANDAHLWVVVDALAELILTGVIEDSNLTVSKPSANIIRYTSDSVTCFDNVLVGDYVIVWSEELSAGNRGEFRVHAKTGSYIEVLVTPAEYAAASPQLAVFQKGFTVVRTDQVPQKLFIPADDYDMNDVADELNSHLTMASFTVDGDEILVFSTNTQGPVGSVTIVDIDASAELLKFTKGQTATSEVSQFASLNSSEDFDSFPLFEHGYFDTGDYADPSADYLNVLDLDHAYASGDNSLIKIAQKFDATKDTLPRNERLLVSAVSADSLTVLDSEFVKRIRTDDRWYALQGYDFSESDLLVTILDDEPTTKNFPIPLYRKAVTNSTYPNTVTGFNAYDSESGVTAEFEDAFGPLFDFANYKAFMRARKVIEQGVAEDALLFRAAVWGDAGEKYNVGYVYPGVPDAGISHAITVGATIDIKIGLKSGPVIPCDQDGTTEFNVTITPNTPSAGLEMVTYSYSGTGTNPNLTLVGGEFVRLTNGSEFAPENIGVFRVSDEAGFTPTSGSFSVLRESGSGVAETAKALLTADSMTFYGSSATTAAEINQYVEDNLADWLTSEIVNKSGTTGAGEITFSTEEFTDFDRDAEFLVDGMNFIKLNNLASSGPQFTFKKSLDMPTATGYRFDGGEEIRFVPTTAVQVSRLASVLAVTGLTTLGTIKPVMREGRIEVGTTVVGSEGAVQFAGGAGNSLTALIESQAVSKDGIMIAPISRSASVGWHGSQWVRLQASNKQRKSNGLRSATTVSVETISGEGVVTLSGRTPTDRFFGDPRKHVFTDGRQFKVEKQGSLVCVTYIGTMGTLAWQKNIELPYDNSDTIEIETTLNTNVVSIKGPANMFAMASFKDKITISGFTDPNNNGTFEIIGFSDDLTMAYYINADASDESMTNITLTVATAIKEGDTVELSAPFSTLNRGKFRVVRTYRDSLYIENSVAVEEITSGVDEDAGIIYSSTSEFAISLSGGIGKLLWTGVGTEPDFSLARVGDELFMSVTDVDANNAGKHPVKGYVTKLKEQSKIILPRGFDFVGGDNFKVHSAGDVRKYAVWYRVTISGTPTGIAPVYAGYTNVQVDIIDTDTNDVVATKTAAVVAALFGGADFVVTQDEETLTVTVDAFEPASPLIDQTMPSDFEVTRTAVGQRTSLEFWAADLTSETVTFTDMNVTVPSIQVFEYDAVRPGDTIELVGTLLLAANAGSYVVSEVLSREKLTVIGLLQTASSPLAGNIDDFFVLEERAYTAYKRILTVAADPGAGNRTSIIFDTDDQWEKVTDSADIVMSAVGKLNFSTSIIRGLDSYRYNIGMIREANRIVYGDPRDSVSYGGISAAGAEIYIEAPAPRRIKIALAVRVRTGVTFGRIQQQVRNAVYAVVLASPIGESIAISKIIAAVDGIPGCKAISVDSPQYDSANDLIIVYPGEKAKILDLTNDIIVSKVE